MSRSFQRKNQRSWIFILLLAIGMVGGSFLGHFFRSNPSFAWLNYGSVFGTKTPLQIQFGFFHLIVGIQIRLTIAGCIGIGAATVLYSLI